jgi:WD40 repeat protein
MMADETAGDGDAGIAHRRLRVFISSPSDVRPERSIAERLIARLSREFAQHFRLEAVLWEREPLVATAHFQDSITPPRQTDVVVVVLWSRLGVPLPLATHPGAVTGRQVTGTEWEFEDAVAAWREHGLPDLLFYRKRAALSVSDDTAQLAHQLQQKQLVDSFVQRWFIDTDASTFKAAFREFRSSAEFEEMLEIHLRELLVQRLAPGGGEAALTIRWHQGSPFRSLESFELEHAQVFFGRTRDRNELRETLARRVASGCAFVLVFGASGSGKSSLVKAGLLADLQLPGMVGRIALCRHAIFKPTDNATDLLAGLADAILRPSALPELTALHYDVPRLQALLRSAPAQALAPLESALASAGAAAQLTPGSQARLVLVIDQLEELFTLEQLDENARHSFVTALDALARGGLVWVVATMRSDFFDRLHELPLLAQLSAGEGRYLLLPPGAPELQRIIRQPATEAGLTYELDTQQGLRLDELLHAQALQAPAALPLLEFTLDQLWQQRSGHGLLTLAAYRQMGGLLGALGRRAEDVFTQQPPDVQAALPAVLRALAHVAPGEGGRVAARVVPMSHFAPKTASRSLVEAMLAPGARLLVAEGSGEGGRVRVAHEALLSHWKRGQDCIVEAQADLQTRSRLEQAQALWEGADATDKRSRLLVRGKPLAEAKDLLDRRRDELDRPVIDYIEASVRADEAADRTERRRLQGAVAIFAMLALGAGLGALAAWQQKQLAQQQARDATSRELAEVAQSLTAADPELAVLVALEALDTSPTAHADRALRVAMQPVPRLHLLGHGQRVHQIAFGNGGRWLATASADGRLRVWDTASGRLLRTLPTDNSPAIGVAASADGRLLAGVHADGSLKVWLPGEGEQRSLSEPPQPERPVTAVAVAPAGGWLASGDRQGRVVLWATATGRRQTSVDISSPVNRLAFSMDGSRLLVATDREAVVCSVPDGKVLVRMAHPAPVLDIAMSRDGKLIATAAGETVRLWASDGSRTFELSQRDGFVAGLAFSADDRFVIAGGQSGRLRWWNTRSGMLASERPAQHAAVRSVVASPDGRWVAAGGDEDTVRLWDAPWPVPMRRLSKNDGEVSNAAFSADGRSAITAHMSGMVRLWDVATGALQREFKADPGEVVSALLSPDGKHVVTAGAQAGAQLWDAGSGQAVRSLLPPGRQVNSATFSADGTTLATASSDGVVRLFGAEGRELPREFRDGGSDSLITAFSRDGRWLATGSADGQVRLWNVADGKLVRRLAGQEQVYGLAFDPRASVLASAGPEGSVRLWNIDNGAPLAQLEAPGHSRVVSLDYSSDGQFLLAAHEDGVVQLWDVPSTSVVMQFGLEGARARNAAFGPNAMTLIVAGSDGAAHVFRCEVCLPLPQLREMAIKRVARRPNDEERRLYFDRRQPSDRAKRMSGTMEVTMQGSRR